MDTGNLTQRNPDMNKESAPKRAYKRHDADFKRRVLEHWEKTRQPAAKVAEAFGVSSFTLYQWRKAHRGPHGGPDGAADLAAENARLREELAIAREQRDILKKSLGILCEPPRRSMPKSKH